MINEFWEIAPALYKWLVFGAMGLTMLGIILLIIGATGHTPAVMFTGVGFIGAGMITHTVSFVYRGNTVRKMVRNSK